MYPLPSHRILWQQKDQQQHLKWHVMPAAGSLPGEGSRWPLGYGANFMQRVGLKGDWGGVRAGIPGEGNFAFLHSSAAAAMEAGAPLASAPSLFRRALRATGRAAAVVLVAAPILGLTALLFNAKDEAAGPELVAALPRTARALWWGMATGARYKVLAAQHSQHAGASDGSVTAAKAELSALHVQCARDLLLLCQANGGLYIKAAQLIVALRAAPPEYCE